MEFRIGISLAKYFSDERSLCYLHMNKNYDTVSKLEDYMRKLFNLKGEFCLLANNYYLPSTESSKIIQPGDNLIVIPKTGWQTPFEPTACVREPVACVREPVAYVREQESDEIPVIEATEQIDDVSLKQAKKKKKKKSKADIEDNIENKLIPQSNPNISLSKKAKKDSITSEDIFETQNDKKKDSMDTSVGSSVVIGLDIDKEIPVDNDISLEQETVTNNVSVNENVHIRSPVDETARTVMTEMDIAMQQLKSKALLLLSDTSQKAVTGVTAGRINKRKRIRKRKNKNGSLTMSVATPDVTETALPTSFTSSSKKPISHIRFNGEEQPLIIQNTLTNNSLPVKPRIVHALDPSETISRRSSVSSMKSADADRPALENDKDPQKEIFSLIVTNGDSLIESLKANLKNYPPMDAVYPVAKDIILFKMLKMDENYTPVVSDYILGTVLEVDKVEGTVKLDIMDGHEKCSKPAGKFSLEEEIEPVESTIINIEWKQVVESRLIFQ